MRHMWVFKRNARTKRWYLKGKTDIFCRSSHTPFVLNLPSFTCAYLHLFVLFDDVHTFVTQSGSTKPLQRTRVGTRSALKCSLFRAMLILLLRRIYDRSKTRLHLENYTFHSVESYMRRCKYAVCAWDRLKHTCSQGVVFHIFRHPYTSTDKTFDMFHHVKNTDIMVSHIWNTIIHFFIYKVSEIGDQLHKMKIFVSFKLQHAPSISCITKIHILIVLIISLLYRYLL